MLPLPPNAYQTDDREPRYSRALGIFGFLTTVVAAAGLAFVTLVSLSKQPEISLFDGPGQLQRFVNDKEASLRGYDPVWRRTSAQKHSHRDSESF
jgi:hypothetical protein